MIIKFSPVRSDDVLEVIKRGEVLVVNGEEFNFSPLQDGATLLADAVSSNFITQSVERIDGQLQITLILPHSATAGMYSRFPTPSVNPSDGRLVLPTDYDAKVSTEDEETA